VITKIYLVTNCYGNPNKVYIGKTKNNRKNGHSIKFGKQIVYTEVDYINSLDHNDWKPLENFWIQYLRFLGFEVLNQNEGGGGPQFVTNEIKLKISLKIQEAGNERNLKIGKPVLQYDLQNNFIQEWSSAKEVRRVLGIIGVNDVCRGKWNKAGGFIWRYKTEPLDKNWIFPKQKIRSGRPKKLKNK
jgi:hypothetical protein